MKHMMNIAAAAALMTGLAAPAQAAFYFEGLQPFTDAPNCNDPYAKKCGRYSHVPHEEGATGDKPHKHLSGPGQLHVPDHEHLPQIPDGRYETRPGLDK